MRCLRIIGCYFYRLTRKHSSIFLVASFIVIITIILQLYSYKHEGDKFQNPVRIANYEYRPGSFLQDQRPNENQTYCKFNYGLPQRLEWGTFKIHRSPEAGIRSNYKVIFNAIEGTAYANTTKYDTVTYVTQATPEFIYHIVEIARYWEGPISLAVFVPDYDMDLTVQIMSHLCGCYSGMSKVSLHLFYPQRLPPLIYNHDKDPTEENIIKNKEINKTDKANENDRNKTIAELKQKVINFRTYGNKTRAEFITMVRQNRAKRLMSQITNKKRNSYKIHFIDCAAPDLSNIVTYRKHFHMVYPINVGRNVARNGSTTNYFIVSDIEMVPSDHLAIKFIEMLKKLMGVKKREDGCIFTRTVFVVPLFEVEKGEEIPRNKETLIRLLAANRASYFHQKTCSHCQRFPGLQSWLARAPPEGVEPMLIGKREYPYHRWEPLYFGTQKEPWYSEIMSWEGRQDKMTQMAELCLLEYRLLVLDGGFLCHAAPAHPAPRRARPERANARHYKAILKRLKGKYKERSQCKLE